MAKGRKREYTVVEGKGLSQARNLATDRILGKIREHGGITGHKVALCFIFFDYILIKECL